MVAGTINAANATNVTNALTSVSEINYAVGFINPLIIKIVTAVLIILMGFIIGKIIQKIIMKLLDLIELDKWFTKATGFKLSIEDILSNVVAYVIYFIAIVIALNKLEITTPVVKTIIIVLAVLLILLFFFGIRDIFANLFAGLVVRVTKNLKLGEHIKVKDKDVEGKIININLLNVQIETDKEELVFIPNIAMFKSQIVKVKNKQEKN